ncbi:MAG: protein kinase domain-containing protein [Planctomycetota bacterium]
MTIERTEHQSSEQLQDARLKSLEPPLAPAELPGYRLLQHLGSGAFGQVWLAIDETTGRKVAIKFYNRRSVGDVNALAREVQKLAALAADRHVVQLLDVGWEADPPFYVMDYIDRGSLEDRLRREKTLPVPEAVEIFQDVATGLLNLHGKGILHCDLKPGNVLLDDDHKPRLADFGQARLSDEAVPSLGTLYYMAPEQADLRAVPDARWDVYALGALLFVMLTGRPPYHEETLSGLMESTSDLQHRLDTYRNGIVRSRPPQRHRKVPGVDKQLADIIDRCIAVDPRKRFPNIQSVLFALRQRQEWISRRPLLLLGLIGPLLLLGVVGLTGWSAYNRAVGDSDTAITVKAAQSNHFAAQLAARSAAEQMDEYFRAVTELAGDVAFQMDLKAAINDRDFADLRLQLADPNRNRLAELIPVRQRFLQHPARVPLDNKLRKLKAAKNLQQVSSWWVYDTYGNQLAGAFEGSGPLEQQKTLGRNYSYRSYFTGLYDDLIEKQADGTVKYPVAPDPRNRQHIMLSHLSAAFLSEASNTWKIAFSAPVFVDAEGDKQCVGVVGLTVEMGDFVEFTATPSQYAIMYDQRPGRNQGLVLEHPLFDAYQQRGETVPSELNDCRISERLLEQLPAQDPLGKSAFGEKYGGRYVTGRADVEFSDLELHADNARRKSGLAVVVFEDYDEIVRPSHELGSKLLNLGLAAAAIALTVAIGMWLLAARMLRQTGRRLARGDASVDDSVRNSAAAESAGGPVAEVTGRRGKTEEAPDSAANEAAGKPQLRPTEVFEGRGDGT